MIVDGSSVPSASRKAAEPTPTKDSSPHADKVDRSGTEASPASDRLLVPKVRSKTIGAGTTASSSPEVGVENSKKRYSSAPTFTAASDENSGPPPVYYSGNEHDVGAKLTERGDPEGVDIKDMVPSPTNATQPAPPAPAQQSSHNTPKGQTPEQEPETPFYLRPNAYLPRNNMVQPAPKKFPKTPKAKQSRPQHGQVKQPMFPRQAQMPRSAPDPYRYVTLPSQRATPPPSRTPQEMEGHAARLFEKAMDEYRQKRQHHQQQMGQPSGTNNPNEPGTFHTAPNTRISAGSWAATGVISMHGPTAVFHPIAAPPSAPPQARLMQTQVPAAKQPGQTGKPQSASKATKSSDALTIRPWNDTTWANNDKRRQPNTMNPQTENKLAQAYALSPAYEAAFSPSHRLWYTAQGGDTHNRPRGGSRAAPAVSTTRPSHGVQGGPPTAGPPPVTSSFPPRDEEPCLNERKFHDDPLHQTYDPCPCKKCRESSRTVFVTGLRNFAPNDPAARIQVKLEFSRYGRIGRVWWQCMYKGVFVV